MSYPPPQDPQQPASQPPPQWQDPKLLPPQYAAPAPPYPMAPPYGPGTPGVQKKRNKLPFVIGGIGAVLVLCLGGTVIAVAAADDNRTEGATGSGASAEPAVVPTTQPATTFPVEPTTAETTMPTATANPTAREWALIVKDPDRHAGDKIEVYGLVTQFDSVTGKAFFRASVGPVRSRSISNQNTLLVGTSKMLDDFVEGDEFRAVTTVIGAETYALKSGGRTTVPKLKIISINPL